MQFNVSTFGARVISNALDDYIAACDKRINELECARHTSQEILQQWKDFKEAAEEQYRLFSSAGV